MPMICLDVEIISEERVRESLAAAISQVFFRRQNEHGGEEAIFCGNEMVCCVMHSSNFDVGTSLSVDNGESMMPMHIEGHGTSLAV